MSCRSEMILVPPTGAQRQGDPVPRPSLAALVCGGPPYLPVGDLSEYVLDVRLMVRSRPDGTSLHQGLCASLSPGGWWLMAGRPGMAPQMPPTL